MGKIKKGDKVKMTEELKEALVNNRCEDHVIEFGECEGEVISYLYPGTKYNDVEVKWNPSGLKYAYNVKGLIKTT